MRFDSYVWFMRLEPVNGVSYLTGKQQFVGVSAEIASARRMLKMAAPPDRLDAVLVEVARIRTEGSVTLVEAMHVVYQAMANGWAPALAR